MAQQQNKNQAASGSWFDSLGSNISQFAQRSIQLGQQGLNQAGSAVTVVAGKTLEIATIAKDATLDVAVKVKDQSVNIAGDAVTKVQSFSSDALNKVKDTANVGVQATADIFENVVSYVQGPVEEEPEIDIGRQLGELRVRSQSEVDRLNRDCPTDDMKKKVFDLQAFFIQNDAYQQYVPGYKSLPNFGDEPEENAVTVIPVAKPLDTEDPLCVLDYHLYIRVLQSCHWDLAHARRKLTTWIKWREEAKPYKIRSTDVKEELQFGAVYVHGRDKKGRPVVYFSPEHINLMKRDLNGIIRLLTFIFETTCAHYMRGEGNDQFTLVYDVRNLSAESFDFMLFREMAALIKLYPERIGPVYIVTGPFYSALWLIGKPFLREKALQRIVEIPHDNTLNLQKYIAADQIPKTFGGSVEWKYNAATVASQLDNKVLPPVSNSNAAPNQKSGESLLQF